MITHREKKPHECPFTDCGKSYCDMRSLRRHLEHNHSSPPGGTTPGYVPKLMLYPELSEEEARKQREQLHSRLSVPEEIPRPSSAPLVPPEPKKIQRTRRSSSGEETHLQLDPNMLLEIEQRKQGHIFEMRRREASEDYIKPREEEEPPIGISPHSSSIASLPNHLLKTVNSPHYGGLEKHKREIEERHRAVMEYEKHYAASRDPKALPISKDSKDYDRHGKHEPFAYPPGLPPRITSMSHSNPPRSSSSAQGNMPYLLNIRNPFTVSPRDTSSYPGQEETSKPSKSELDPRHQAMNTYIQMWANGQHNNLTPEQLYMYQNRGAPHPHSQPPPSHRSAHPSTPTDAISIAVASAKEPSDRHSYALRENVYGIHPVNAKWQSVRLYFSFHMNFGSRREYFD